MKAAMSKRRLARALASTKAHSSLREHHLPCSQQREAARSLVSGSNEEYHRHRHASGAKRRVMTLQNKSKQSFRTGGWRRRPVWRLTSCAGMVALQTQSSPLRINSRGGDELDVTIKIRRGGRNGDAARVEKMLAETHRAHCQLKLSVAARRGAGSGAKSGAVS